jgi:hypothetical protein
MMNIMKMMLNRCCHRSHAGNPEVTGDAYVLDVPG